MEFSGYSYHRGGIGSDNIRQDALTLIEFLNQILGFNYKNMTIIGRSIGSGPAIYLSSLFEFRSVIVISGFLSVKKIAKDRFSFLQFLFGKYFDNEKLIKQNKNQILFIHGKNDEMIKCRHSEKMHSMAGSKSSLILFEDMKHNEFDFMKCVIYPVTDFLAK